MSLVSNLTIIRNNLSCCLYNPFSFIHYITEIKVGSIGFHCSEFRVMVWIHPFIPENPTKFINPFKATNNQPLQVKLSCDPQVHINIQSIVVGNKWTGIGAPSLGIQNWRLNFSKAVFIHVATHCLNDRCPLVETLEAFRIRNKVKVTLTINCFRISNSFPLIWKWTKSLG